MTWTHIIRAMFLQKVEGADPVASRHWLAVRKVIEDGEVEAGQFMAWAEAHWPIAMVRPMVSRLTLGTLVEERIERLAAKGIYALTIVDAGYPQVWAGEHARYPLLFVQGESALVDQVRVSIVGSRSASEDVLEATSNVAGSLADQGIVIASGGAVGVDMRAEDAALASGGSVVLVPASHWQTALRHGRKSALKKGRLALFSPYDPESGFTVGNAMGRNRVLSRWPLLVMSCEQGTGGSWAGATQALREHHLVLAWTGKGQSSGATALIDLGARPVDSTEAVIQQITDSAETNWASDAFS